VTEEELRQSVVFAALFEYHAQKFLRIGDDGAGGKGPPLMYRMRPLRNDKAVAGYWRAVLGPKWKGPRPNAWCGAFALWCLQEAGLAPGVLWLVNHVNGTGIGFCEPQGLPHIPAAEVKPGDVAYFARWQHHAIVEKVVFARLNHAANEGSELWSIDGNQPAIDRHGPQGSLPARKLSDAAAFYSIAPFITAALALPVQKEGNNT